MTVLTLFTRCHDSHQTGRRNPACVSLVFGYAAFWRCSSWFGFLVPTLCPIPTGHTSESCILKDHLGLQLCTTSTKHLEKFS